MTATEKARRAESLYQDRAKRELADMVVHRESDIDDLRNLVRDALACVRESSRGFATHPKEYRDLRSRAKKAGGGRMSYKIGFDPTSDKWALSDGEHYLEVPHWAREIVVNEFERETRQLKDENAKLQNDADLLRSMLQAKRKDTHALMSENAELRETLQRRSEQFEGMTEMWVERGAENFKLRELVRHMRTCMEHYEVDGTISCDRCPLDNDTGNCDFEQRMRELGVDV